MFGLSIVFGFAKLGVFSLVCLVAFAALFIYAVLVLFGTHNDRTCGNCNRPLETVWPVTSEGVASEYRICRHCHLFRYMFRTSRR